MRPRVLAILTAVLAATALASSSQKLDPQPAGPRFEALESPAAAESSEPQLSVSSRGVLLSWIERAGPRATLKFAERTKSGWTAAQTVASGDDWFVNWADVPSVIRLDNGALAAHWLQKSATSVYDVRLSYSTDDGRTWAPSLLPHHDGTRSEHGFVSLFQMPQAGLGLVWLDGRAKQMALRFTTFDAVWKQTADVPVDARVCDCCPTAAAVTSEGPIVAYRDRSDTEIRDISVSRFEHGAWTTPVPVFKDDWQISACPVNGPAIAARGRNVAVAWFTGKDPAGQAFMAFSHDSGRTFGPPIRLDDAGTLGRVGVVLTEDGPAVASWIDYTAKRAEIRVRIIEPTGQRVRAVTVAPFTSDRSSGFPRLAAGRGELVMAWTESTRGADGTARLHVLTAAAPWLKIEPLQPR